MSYSEKVLDHFQNPRNVGELHDADAEARVEHPVCGDIMKLGVRVADDRIAEVKFRTRGCVASIAAGSVLTEMMRGKPLSEVRSITREQIAAGLGELPNASIHATHLAIETLEQVLNKLAAPKS